MKVEKLMHSMNDIKDNYIIEYAEKSKTAKTKATHYFKTWGVVAACLALVLICTPTLIHFFTPSEAVDPKAGVQYDFNSYAELCEILPEGSLIPKIPDNENAKIESYGICPEGTTDFTDIGNYSYLFIDVSYNDNTGMAINCTLNAEKTLEEICKDSLKYPPDNTKTTIVADTEVYYTFYFDTPYGEEEVKINKVAFIIDGNLYEIRSSTLNNENLIQFVSDMLNK